MRCHRQVRLKGRSSSLKMRPQRTFCGTCLLVFYLYLFISIDPCLIGIRWVRPCILFVACHWQSDAKIRTQSRCIWGVNTTYVPWHLATLKYLPGHRKRPQIPSAWSGGCSPHRLERLEPRKIVEFGVIYLQRTHSYILSHYKIDYEWVASLCPQLKNEPIRQMSR